MDHGPDRRHPRPRQPQAIAQTPTTGALRTRHEHPAPETAATTTCLKSNGRNTNRALPIKFEAHQLRSMIMPQLLRQTTVLDSAAESACVGEAERGTDPVNQAHDVSLSVRLDHDLGGDAERLGFRSPSRPGHHELAIVVIKGGSAAAVTRFGAGLRLRSQPQRTRTAPVGDRHRAVLRTAPRRADEPAPHLRYARGQPHDLALQGA